MASILALVYDFDGLILETEEPIFQSWQELFRAHGCELAFETWAEIIGTADGPFDPLAELEAQLGRPVDRASLALARRRRETELILSRPILPGVHETLAAARRLGLRRAVASSSSRAWVAGHLERLGLLADFDLIRTADDVQRTKPNPDLYLAAVHGLGVRPDQALAFEDSPNGIRAAKEAGLVCVAVPTPLTRKLPMDGADRVVDSLAAQPLEVLLRQLDL